ncbi:MAG TPA: regulatory protein RecX [Thermomicrobiales bacterium]|jgi:regulatory protein|nr:regulatory protein RecX [Thermomicrobiales bacterium]
MRRQKSPLVRPPRAAEAGKIASVTSAGRGGRRVEITMESGTTYTVDSNVAYDAGIAPNLTLEQAEIQALLDSDDLLAAKQVATRQLSYRPRSISELRQTLGQRGFGPQIIDQVIERFSELGYLDDADFARRWIQTREQLAPRGTRLLKQELRQKGIDTDLADEALADADLDELDAATRIAERRLPKMTGLDRDTQRRRLAGYLERRGFSHDVVRQIDRKYFREM